MSSVANVRPIRTLKGTDAQNKTQGFLHRWLLPHSETQMVAQQAKGVFLPYPLLGIIVTMLVLLVSGIVTLEVQVSNLSTTILLRDADQRATIVEIKEELSKHQVYIHDDREKLIRLQTEQEQTKRR